MGKRNIRIQDVTVEVNAPYSAGHTLKAREATALNQVRAENIANNVRTQVKELIAEHGADAGPHVQEVVKAYDAKYDLERAPATRTSMDPVTREALAIARQTVKDHLIANGKKLADYREGTAKERYDAEVKRISQLPKVVQGARAAVAARAKPAEAVSL